MRTRTRFGVSEVPSAVTEPLEGMVEVLAEALPPLNTTVPPVSLIGDVMESVFTSAWVELNVQVEEPVALVAEQAW